MSRFTVLLILTCAGVTYAASVLLWPGGAGLGPVVAEAPAGPLAGRTSVDLGRIDAPAEPIRQTFALTNATGGPITVADVKTSCGCTGAEFPREPIPPGGAVPVTLTIDWHDRQGPQRVSGVVTFADGTPPVTLEFAAHLPSRAMVVPPVVRLPRDPAAGGYQVVTVLRGELSEGELVDVVTSSPGVVVTLVNQRDDDASAKSSKAYVGRFAITRDANVSTTTDFVQVDFVIATESGEQRSMLRVLFSP